MIKIYCCRLLSYLTDLFSLYSIIRCLLQCGAQLRAIAPAENAASFEEMVQRRQAVTNIDPIWPVRALNQTSRYRDERVTARPTFWYINVSAFDTYRRYNSGCQVCHYFIFFIIFFPISLFFVILEPLSSFHNFLDNLRVFVWDHSINCNKSWVIEIKTFFSFSFFFGDHLINLEKTTRIFFYWSLVEFFESLQLS